MFTLYKDSSLIDGYLGMFYPSVIRTIHIQVMKRSRCDLHVDITYMTRNAQKTGYERGVRKHWIHAPQSANGADKAILTTDNIDTDSCANQVTVLPWRAVDKNIEITDNYILSLRAFWKLFGYKKDLKD